MAISMGSIRQSAMESFPIAVWCGSKLSAVFALQTLQRIAIHELNAWLARTTLYSSAFMLGQGRSRILAENARLPHQSVKIEQCLDLQPTHQRTLTMTSSLDRPAINREHLSALDDKLSKRHIPLDPAGYFIIYIDEDQGLICAKHYGVVVNDRGLAIDPDTGKPLSAKGTLSNPLLNTYTGRTAKELCIAVFENPEQDQPPVTYIDHAAYLGREFQKAEVALLAGTDYIQD